MLPIIEDCLYTAVQEEGIMQCL